MNQEITQGTLFKLYIASVLTSLKHLEINTEQVDKIMESMIKRGEVYGYSREKVLEVIQNELNNL